MYAHLAVRGRQLIGDPPLSPTALRSHAAMVLRKLCEVSHCMIFAISQTLWKGGGNEKGVVGYRSRPKGSGGYRCCIIGSHRRSFGPACSTYYRIKASCGCTACG